MWQQLQLWQQIWEGSPPSRKLWWIAQVVISIPLGNWQNQMRNRNPVVYSMKLQLWTAPAVNRGLSKFRPKNNVKKTQLYLYLDIYRYIYHIIKTQYISCFHHVSICIHSILIKTHNTSASQSCETDQSYLYLWPGNASNKYPGLRHCFLKSCLNYCNISGNSYSTQLIHHFSIFLNRH